jgi:glycosyltransferase 2 family protein
MNNRLKRGLTLAAGLSVLAAALLYSILTKPEWRQFDSAVFLASFGQVHWPWIALAFLLVYSTYVIRALRWQILIRPVKPRPRFWNLLSATVVGFGAIAVMGRPGEFVRPYLIAKKEQVAVSGQIAVWVLERSFDILIVLAGVAFAVGQFQPASVDAPLQWWHTLGRSVGAAAVILLALLVVLRGYYDLLCEQFLRLLQRLAGDGPRSGVWVEKARKPLAVFGEGLHSLRDWRAVAGCLLWSALHWLLVALCYHAVLVGCAPNLRFHFAQAVIFLGVVMAGSAFQVPGVGGGVQIAAVLGLTEIFGMPVELASSTAIVVWFLTFLAVLPPALILLLHDGWSWAKLRHLESEA